MLGPPRVPEPPEVVGRVRRVVRGLGPDVRAAPPRAERVARAAGAVAGDEERAEPTTSASGASDGRTSVNQPERAENGRDRKLGNVAPFRDAASAPPQLAPPPVARGADRVEACR